MKGKLHRLAFASVIWLTAASTLFGSVPHIECRCPNGRLKLICLASWRDPAACCDSDCSEPARAAPAPSGDGCCCKRAAPMAVKGQARPSLAFTSSTVPQAGRDGCSKQLVQPGLTLITYTQVITLTSGDLTHLDLHTSSTTDVVDVGATLTPERPSHHPPASPDLVVVFEHFLI